MKSKTHDNQASYPKIPKPLPKPPKPPEPKK